MYLIVAEKKSVAIKIAEYLGVVRKENSYIQANNFIVVWASGHLVELVEPEAYDSKYKKWKLIDLPILPKSFRYKLKSDKKSKDSYKVIKSFMQDEKISEIVCATDAGREGQLIFEWIYQQAKCSKPVKRLWFSSLEKIEIEHAFKTMKDNDYYKGYRDAASARAKADWLIGMNFSRYYKLTHGSFSKKHKGMNVGRVLTPTLAAIVEREQIIQQFIPQTYYEIEAHLDSFSAKLITDQVIDDQKKAEAIYSACLGKKMVVVDIKKVRLTAQKAPLLYNLLHLQKDAFSKHHFNPKQTSNYAQQLYEKGLISYPRTDSMYLTDAFKDSYDDLLNTLVSPFPNTQVYLDNLHVLGLNIQDSIIGQVSDHHAIIITSELKDYPISSLSDGEMKLLKLIITRMLCSVDQAHTTIRHDYVLKIDNYMFSYSFNSVETLGWKQHLNLFYSNDKPDNYPVELYIDESLNVEDLLINEKRTKPKSRYNYSTLLSYMEKPKSFDTDAVDIVQEISLGTEATRADIIDTLVSKDYIRLNTDKTLYPSYRGSQIMNVMMAELRSPELTQKWEYQLNLVNLGTITETEFIKEITQFINSKMMNLKLRSLKAK